ncbi:hypothetical protein T4B_7576 [Trichinella pseudospiralis]|uniref:Uncharacterized protein n=1 Tax=Trichinella pseudospiralis TaxID=6337 RepID=A0A0V1IHA7_TRIPS|nr:hypothetical protein T4B_7576 [Trichinella pseudospiralis]
MVSMLCHYKPPTMNVTNHTTDDQTTIAQRQQQQQRRRQNTFPCTVYNRENQVRQDRRKYRNIKRLYIGAKLILLVCSE